jgi:small conductance mechanosensitive channel
MFELAERWLQPIGAWLAAHWVPASGAAIIALTGLVIAVWSGLRVRRSLARIDGLDRRLREFAEVWVRRIVGGLAAMMALAQLGVASDILLFGVISVAVLAAVVCRSQLSHLLAGLLLTAQRSFRVGERIEACGVRGTVCDIGPFVTLVRTADGVLASIPNGLLGEGTILNLTRLPSWLTRVTSGMV